MKKQKLILLMVIITAFATTLFLPGVTRADVIVDNADLEASFTGTWGTSAWAPGYYKSNYGCHAPGDGSDTFSWTPTVAIAGTYKVWARWTTSGEPDTTRADDATYTIHHDDGITPVVIDQQYNGGEWLCLGVYSFDGVDVEKVELVQSENGYVIADAIKLELLAVVVREEAAYEGWSKKISSPARFKLVMDGEAVLDKETGLVWEKAPTTDDMTWGAACWECYRSETGGRMGWRLPTIAELTSLIDPSNSYPALPAGHIFENLYESGQAYWTATTHITSPDRALVVGLYDGGIGTPQKDLGDPPIPSIYHPWCVRGGQGHDAY